MILVPEDDEKTKVNNQKGKFAEKVVDSALRVAGAMEQKPMGNKQAGGDILDVVDPNAEPAQGGGSILEGIDPNNPFKSSIPTVSSGGVTVPSWSVNDVFNTRIESTEAPVRDAAAYERIQKQQKFNTISKGIQAIFGGFVASQGEVAPSPYESGMTQQLMQNLQGLDDKYFREMAEYRDRELRGEIANANMQAQKDQAILQKRISDVQALRDAGKFKEAQAAAEEAEQYKRKMDQKKLNLDLAWRDKQGKDADLSSKIQTIRAYEAQYDDLQRQYEAATEDMDDKTAKSIKEQMDKNMSVREQLMKQLSSWEGFKQDDGKKPPKNLEEFQERFKKSIGIDENAKSQQNPTKPSSVPNVSPETRNKTERILSEIIQSRGKVSESQLEFLLSIEGMNEDRLKSFLAQKGFEYQLMNK